MSIDLVTAVWKSKLARPEKLVCLAIAHHVEMRQEDCYASYSTLARETSYEERQVMRIVDKLISKGIVVHRGQHPVFGTNVLNIEKDRLPQPLEQQQEDRTVPAASQSDYQFLTPRLLQIFVALSARDGFRCRFPGCRSQSLQIDHIVPRARGGGDDLSNLQLLCAHHNAKKSSRGWDAFLKQHWEQFHEAFQDMQAVMHEWNAIGYSSEDNK